MAELVKMTRDSADEPKAADVHPDEVENYKAGGWVVAEKPPAKKAKADAKQD